MKSRFWWLLILIPFVFGSCAMRKKVIYFQNSVDSAFISLPPSADILLRPADKVSIVVNSRDPLLTNLFNLPYVTRYLGYNNNGVGNSQGMLGYTVDGNGDIEFPVLGRLHVAGMKRSELAEFIRKRLVDEELVADPVVTVDYLNLSVSVLGEVNRPGRIAIDKDQLTVLDAISQAGDLTILGRRDNVLVHRREGGELKSYRINLTSQTDVYKSPVFYLRQGDVVYVEPNPYRSRQSTVNGNNLASVSFWISFMSFLSSLTTTISLLVTKK